MGSSLFISIGLSKINVLEQPNLISYLNKID